MNKEIYEASMPRTGEKKDPNDHRDTGAIREAISAAKPIENPLAEIKSSKLLEKDTPSDLPLSDVDADVRLLLSWIQSSLFQEYEIDTDAMDFINISALSSGLSKTFWSGAKSKLFLLSNGGLNQFSEKDALKQFQIAFGEIIDWGIFEKVIQNIDNDAKQRILQTAFRETMAFIKAYRQAERLEFIVDMFAEEPRMEFNDERVRIYLTHKPFRETEFDDRYVADFKDHFPQLDEIISFIVATRFAIDRKHCYLWLWADSDFGKGFFAGILVNLGCVVETSEKEVEALFGGKPIAKAPEDFKRAFVLLIDEPKSVKGELKQLQSTIQISPKFQLSANVEVFLKFFTSKEVMRGFFNEGIVEDQFANRFNIITGKGSLTDRPLFKAQKPGYTKSVQGYVAKRLNTLVKEYQNLGRECAEVKADDEIAKFREKYRVSKTHRIASENLPDLANQFVEWLASKFVRDEFSFSGKVAGQCVTILIKPAKAYEAFVESEYSRYDQKSVGFQQNDVMKLIQDDSGKKQHKIDCKNVRGIRLNQEFKNVFDTA